MNLTQFWSAFMTFVGMALLIACSEIPNDRPWNMAPQEEWNSPLEASWINLCDNIRNWTAPKGKVWNPILQTYEQDLSEEIYLLRKEDGRFSD